MSGDIYQQQIKELARAATGACQFTEEEKAANNCVTLDNPLCGDRVMMAVKLKQGKIEQVRHEVRGCLLCQAAASVIGASAKGASAEDIDSLMDDLSMLLKQGTQPECSGWSLLTVFQPVSQHKSRHACVLLPFKALVKALQYS